MFIWCQREPAQTTTKPSDLTGVKRAPSWGKRASLVVKLLICWYKGNSEKIPAVRVRMG